MAVGEVETKGYRSPHTKDINDKKTYSLDHNRATTKETSMEEEKELKNGRSSTHEYVANTSQSSCVCNIFIYFSTHKEPAPWSG
jgi:hypothetical protein